MSRSKKDPLRSLTDAERQALTYLSRSQSAPAVQVARATLLLAVAGGDDYQTAARIGRPAFRRCRLTSGRPVQCQGPGRHIASPRRRPSRSTTMPREGESFQKSDGAHPRGRRHGHLVARAPSRDRSDPPPTACPRSPPQRSGRYSTRPANHSEPGPGVPPGPHCASARPGWRSSSTRTPGQKKLIEERLPPGRGDGPAGLVPDQAGPFQTMPSRPVLGARGQTGRASPTSTSATARPRS